MDNRSVVRVVPSVVALFVCIARRGYLDLALLWRVDKTVLRQQSRLLVAAVQVFCLTVFVQFCLLAAGYTLNIADDVVAIVLGRGMAKSKG